MKIGDKLDCRLLLRKLFSDFSNFVHITFLFPPRDLVGRFTLSEVVEKDENTSKLKIHFVGWGSKWDEWIDVGSELYRFAEPESWSRSIKQQMLM